MSGLAGKTALITGATGFIGGRLAERLLIEQEVTVRALVRDPRKTAWLSRTRAELWPGDITDAESVRVAAAGCQLVFHCAAHSSLDRSLCHRVNVQGTENVIHAAMEAGAERMVHVSTATVHGPCAPGCADELAPMVSCGTTYSDTKRDGEMLAWRYHHEHGLPLVVIRPTIVYGPRASRWSVLALQRIQNGALALPGKGSGAADVVYVDDLVDALILSARRPQAVGEAFIISNDEPVTWRQFYGCYARMAGRNLVCWPRPAAWGLAAAMEGIDRGILAASRGLPSWLPLAAVIGLRAMRKLTLPLRCLEYWELGLLSGRNRFSIDKARQMLGYTPRFSLEDGMRQTETWFRAQGYLPQIGPAGEVMGQAARAGNRESNHD